MLKKGGTKQEKSGTAGNLATKSGTVPLKEGQLETMLMHYLPQIPTFMGNTVCMYY